MEIRAAMFHVETSIPRPWNNMLWNRQILALDKANQCVGRTKIKHKKLQGQNATKLSGVFFWQKSLLCMLIFCRLWQMKFSLQKEHQIVFW